MKASARIKVEDDEDGSKNAKVRVDEFRVEQCFIDNGSTMLRFSH